MKTIFVSSTFADMQQERNLIHTRIMPEINDSLREQGESAKFLDFRWGVNTESLDEESAMRKVLSTCFDGILNSSYVIVFIGNRYGTSVPYPIMHDICKKYGISTLDTEKSITELEVEFATEKNFIDSKNVIFYFKMSNDNEKEDTRVGKLKNQIKELYPLQVRYYEENLESNSESFVDLVVNDILRLLENEKSSTFEYYENKLSLEYSSRFSCRESQLNEAISTIFNDKLTVISGPSGSGKTVFISALRERVKDLSHTNIQYISQSCYGINLVERRVWNMLGTILRDTYSVKLNNNCFGNPIRKSLIELCQLYRNLDNKKPIFIFLDGIDKANTIMDITDFFDFIEEFCDDFHFVISISNPDLYVFPNDINQIALSPLNRIEKLKVINYELEAFQKKLDKNAVELLLNKRDSELPLYLRLAIKRLVLMQKEDYYQIQSRIAHAYWTNQTVETSNVDTAAIINKYIYDTIEGYSHDMENMVLDYIDFAINSIEDKRLAVNVISYMSASHFGYTDTELLLLIDKYGMFVMPDIMSFRKHKVVFVSDTNFQFKFSECELYWFRKYLDGLIYQKACGENVFENTIVKNSVHKLYHGDWCDKHIANEIYEDCENRIVPDIEIMLSTIRSGDCKKIFIFINDIYSNGDNELCEQLNSALILYNIEQNTLENLLIFANRNSCTQTIKGVRYLIQFLIPTITNSYFDPLQFSQFFKDCLKYLKKNMDYAAPKNRLYLIMAKLNIAIMLRRGGYFDMAHKTAQECFNKLKAIPLASRDTLYNDALFEVNDFLN